MVRRNFLNAAETAAVTQAIEQAERRSAAEIVVMIAPQSDFYELPSLLLGLSIGTCVAVAIYWLGMLHDFYVLLLIQIGAMLASFSFLQMTGLVPLLAGQEQRRKNVRRAAGEIFFTHRLHMTARHIGVLLYVSTRERCVELIVDTGIAAVIDDSAWQHIVTDLTTALRNRQAGTGLVKAIENCAALLADHFPPMPGDRNELPDKPVELHA